MRGAMREEPKPIRWPAMFRHLLGRTNMGEIGRFLLVGLWATLLDYALFWIALWFMPQHEGVCFILGFTISVLCRFLLDKRFTFRNRDKQTARQATLYFGSCLITLAIGFGVFRLGLRLGIGPLPAKIVSIPCVTAGGYLLFRYIVFAPAGKRTV